MHVSNLYGSPQGEALRSGWSTIPLPIRCSSPIRAPKAVECAMNRARLSFERRQCAQAYAHHLQQCVSPGCARRDFGDQSGKTAQGLRPVASGLCLCALRRSQRRARSGRRQHGDPARTRAGRRRHPPGVATTLPAGAARHLQRTRPDAGVRRSAVRRRAHRIALCR